SPPGGAPRAATPGKPRRQGLPPRLRERSLRLRRRRGHRSPREAPVILLLALLAAAPDAGTTTAAAGAALKNPVSITADKLQVLNKRRQAIYTGHVVAVRGTTRIKCGRMVASYTEA